jgi:hypothetical protein
LHFRDRIAVVNVTSCFTEPEGVFAARPISAPETRGLIRVAKPCARGRGVLWPVPVGAGRGPREATCALLRCSRPLLRGPGPLGSPCDAVTRLLPQAACWIVQQQQQRARPSDLRYRRGFVGIRGSFLCVCSLNLRAAPCAGCSIREDSTAVRAVCRPARSFSSTKRSSPEPLGLRLVALFVLQIHSLKGLFLPDHRDFTVQCQFSRTRCTLYIILHTNHPSVGPTNKFF